MEKDELREIISQLLAGYKRNVPVRAVLVSVPSDHLVQKLVPGIFERISFIPYRRGFRIALGQLNDRQYEEFKKRYYDRLLFYLIPLSVFLDLPEKLLVYGIGLRSFILRGPGRMVLTDRDSHVVMETFGSFRRKGFIPTSMEFQNGDNYITLKRDFSLRMRGDPQAVARDVVRIIDSAYEGSEKLMEKLSALRLRINKLSHSENFTLHRVQGNQESFLRLLSREFSVQKLSEYGELKQYIVSGGGMNGFVPLVSGIHLRMIPDTSFSIEIATRIIEISEKELVLQ